MSLFWSQGNTHWSCKIFRSPWINAMLIKRNQVSLVYYSIVSSPWIKRESKLCYFPKICSTTNSSKTWHSQDLTRNSASLSPLRTTWTSKQSCLSLPWIKINTRRNLAEFYNVSSARNLVSSRNSWPCCCNCLRWPEPIYMRFGYVFESRFSPGTIFGVLNKEWSNFKKMLFIFL